MSNQPPYGYPPPGPPPGPPPNKTKFLGLDYNLAALLCYVPWCCCLIDLIASVTWLASEPRENRFLRFHALQGLLLFGVVILLSVIFEIMGVGARLNPSDIGRAGGSLILFMFQMIIGLALLVIHIIGMVKAYQGQMWKIPIIGDIAEKNA
ncbi:MAG TPA: Tic20 family protein [Blastocatellia bacterium]|nr:Tic20 family protein [Blastocatellia bacterium]